MKIKKTYILLITITTFSLQLITFKILSQASFFPAINFPVGSSPQSVISADFNSDGKADLAIANETSKNISILLGDGLGGFSTATNFTLNSNPISIISADFNNDGKADLAIVSLNDSSVSVSLGNGTGGFGSVTRFAGGLFGSFYPYPHAVISADFNGDGKADLALANWDWNNVSILLGDGMGSFGAGTIFTAGTNSLWSLTSADFNADGKPDLATVSGPSHELSVLLGNGAGGFGSSTIFTVGGNPHSVISADFNGDGKVDLASANTGTSDISVLLGNGIGGFGTATNFPVGNSPWSVISADFNADGKADLAIADGYSNVVSILLGNGAGSFGSPTTFPVGSSPSSIISADFNGDGKPDLATANTYSNNVSILLNNPFGAIPPTPNICIVTVDSTLTHNVIVWEKTNLDMSAIDSFVVYREITTNNYQRIGAVSHNFMSAFNDFAANPSATGYRYKLKSKSSHGIESLLSSNYHNTMYLTHAGADFSWTPYQIENTPNPVAAYKIYRDNNSTGNFQSIGNTTGNQLGYTDVNYASYPNASYYVEAVMTSGTCHPTRSGYAASRSNVKHIGINGVQQLNNLSTITIYPNPATNTITITGITGKTLLRLFDVVGKIIIEKEVENNTSIDASLLAEGSYTLLTSSKYGETFNKVVISR